MERHIGLQAATSASSEPQDPIKAIKSDDYRTKIRILKTHLIRAEASIEVLARQNSVLQQRMARLETRMSQLGAVTIDSQLHSGETMQMSLNPMDAVPKRSKKRGNPVLSASSASSSRSSRLGGEEQEMIDPTPGSRTTPSSGRLDEAAPAALAAAAPLGPATRAARGGYYALPAGRRRGGAGRGEVQDTRGLLLPRAPSAEQAPAAAAVLKMYPGAFRPDMVELKVPKKGRAKFYVTNVDNMQRYQAGPDGECINVTGRTLLDGDGYVAHCKFKGIFMNDTGKRCYAPVPPGLKTHPRCSVLTATVFERDKPPQRLTVVLVKRSGCVKLTKEARRGDVAPLPGTPPTAAAGGAKASTSTRQVRTSARTAGL